MAIPAPLNPRVAIIDPQTGYLTADGFRFLQNLRGVVAGDDGSGLDGIEELNDRLTELDSDAGKHIATLNAKMNSQWGRLAQIRKELLAGSDDLELLIHNLRAQTQTAAALLRNLKITTYAKGLLNVANEAAFKALTNLEIGTDVQAYDAILADLAGLTLAQGDVLYFDGTNLANLGAGTSGQFLKTNGAGADPAWAGAFSTRAHKNGTNQAITGTDSAGTFTKVTWAAANFDTGSWFDDANDRLTVGATGKYLISALVHFTGGIAIGDLLELRGYINGSASTPRTHTVAPAAVDTQVPLNDVLNLTSGDYVEIFAQKGGADSALYGNSGQTYLTLTFLGA